MRTKLIALVLTPLAVVPLAGCGGTKPSIDITLPSVDLTVPSLPSVDLTLPTLPSLPTVPSVSLPDAAEGEPGTVSLTITQPVAISGWAPVPVTCAAEGRNYTASFEGAVVAAGVSVGASVTAAPYKGAGTFPGVGSVSLTTPATGTVTVPLASPVKVEDDLDGTVEMSVNVQGIAVAFSLTWHCTA